VEAGAGCARGLDECHCYSRRVEERSLVDGTGRDGTGGAGGACPVLFAQLSVPDAGRYPAVGARVSGHPLVLASNLTEDRGQRTSNQCVRYSRLLKRCAAVEYLEWPHYKAGQSLFLWCSHTGPLPPGTDDC
jgi:hypothetical protein